MDTPRLSRIQHGRPSRFFLVFALGFALAAGGCSAPGGVKQAMGKSMEAFGLKKPAAPDPNVEYSVPLRLYAGENLNAGAEKKSLALVVRIYQLKDIQRFEQAPFEAFLDEKREKEALGGDLIEVNEILMTPGQRHEVQQKMPGAASHLGVVALFRSPATSRWRFSFEGRKAVKDGITIGLHACAMTATDTAALTTVLSSPANSLSSTNCSKPGR
ncbi:type VI secretion system lipoprotein TssJ [Lysobacter enzymogenes]|uniref:type VI secretion system lipoprotein TssJ n=1 Tax=Lysobacter enzymogenes TaxID=69 RepID=UPI001AF5834F|nr:type VI secretion system lipoprotein TssJ [Lysobacter enzymogenes]QQQ00755.1 type VI secretion system lipoprotein TssJ [Lysobacter enzymogenes]